MQLPRYIYNFLFLSAIAILLQFFIPTAGAQASPSANAAQGLQISPTRIEQNTTRGASFIIKVNVLNVTASDQVYTPSVKDFGAKDETGSPNIVQNSRLPNTASIISWVDEIPKFTLHPRESRLISVRVNVPNNAEPGGHYGALSFAGSSPELEGTAVGLAANTGMLILIRVDGAINESAELASFYSADLNGKQNFFFESSPIKFITRIKNTGNIHVKPSGSIEIKDVFGGIVDTMSVNKDNSNVLPNSIRRFGDDKKLDKSWMFGLYTANLTLGYGTTGQAITNTISFWVMPYKIIFISLLVLVTMLYIFKKMIKAYNKSIIEKAKNETKNKKNHSKQD